MIPIIFSLLAVSILFVAITGFLLNTLKIWQYLSLYTAIFACYFLFSSLGQISTYLVLTCSILLITIFSKEKLANIMGALFGYLFSVMLNNLLLNILPLLFHTSIKELTLLGTISFQVMFLLLLCGISLCFRIWGLPRLSFLSQKSYHSFCVFVIIEEFICTSIYIFLIVYGEQMGYPTNLISTTSILFLLFFVSITIIFVLIIRTLFHEQQIRYKLDQLETLENYTKDLEQLHRIMRSMNHDYKNLFSTASSFIENNDLDGLKSFYQKSLHRLSMDFESSYKEIGNLTNIYLPELKGLLYSKSLNALALNLSLQIRIDYEIHSVSIDSTDLVRILGIYLDNAIEAASETEDKQILIYFTKNGEHTTWIISNSTNEIVLPLHSLNEYGVSTKGSNRGIGLSTVSKLLSRYPHILANTTLFGSTFTQTLEGI